MRMSGQEGAAARVLSIIGYLRNLFGEESFVTGRGDGMWVKTLRETPESARFMGWIAAIESRCCEIHRVVLGIHRATELVEVYGINLREIGDLKGLCLHLQKMDGLQGPVSLRMKVYSSTAAEMGGFTSSRDCWNVEALEAEHVEGVTIYRRPRSRRVYAAAEEGGDIRCICTVHNRDGDMIQCIRCHSWLHTICIGFFSNRDGRIPRVYTCQYCSGTSGIREKCASTYRTLNREIEALVSGLRHSEDILATMEQIESRKLAVEKINESLFANNKGLCRDVCRVCHGRVTPSDTHRKMAKHNSGRIHMAFLEIRNKIGEIAHRYGIREYDRTLAER